jgi:hypothetical protein
MTGYTHMLVEKNLSFAQFALACARAFGACVMLRDEPADAPIPERFEPSDWNLVKAREAEAKAERYALMSKGELLELGQRLRREAIAYHEQRVAERRESLRKMREALAEAQKWEPPTPGHEGLKKFMLQQLTDSIESESDPQDWLEEAKAKSPEQYADEEVRRASADVIYHTEKYAEEVKRTEQRNAWLAALRGSL